MSSFLAIFLPILLFMALLIVAWNVIYILYGRLWFRAQAAGAAVPLFSLIGMGLRGVSPRAVVAGYIAAKKASVEVSLEQLEAHYRAGGSPEELVRRISASRFAGQPLDVERASAEEIASKSDSRGE